MIDRINRTPRTASTFFLSLLPGVGHMYLGLMRRGVEFLLSFFACIFIIGDLMSISQIGVPLTFAVFFYNLFDVQQFRKSILRGENVKDVGFLNLEEKHITSYHIGIGFIVLGAFLLLNRILWILPYDFRQHAMYNFLRNTTGSLLLIAAGIYLIMKSRKKQVPSNPINNG